MSSGVPPAQPPANVPGNPAGNPDVHLTPDAGIQTFPEPYPAFRSARGPQLNGRVVVHVVAAQGSWVQLSVDGDVVGWVDGRGLVPPVGGPSAQPMPISPRETHYPVNALPPAAAQGLIMTIETVIGGVAALGIAVGALIDWTKGRFAQTSFKVPVEFLFDSKTTSRNPKLGYVLLLVGLLGLLASFFAGARPGRVLLGLLAVSGTVLFCAQIAANIPDGSDISMTDLVGSGPWVTGIAGIVLAFSPLAKTKL